MAEDRERNTGVFVDAHGGPIDLSIGTTDAPGEIEALERVLGALLAQVEAGGDCEYFLLVSRLLVSRVAYSNTSEAIKMFYGGFAHVVSHATETFGSENAALGWLSLECGALNNRTPLTLIQERNAAEVERILDCIDYGMIA